MIIAPPHNSILLLLHAYPFSDLPAKKSIAELPKSDIHDIFIMGKLTGNHSLEVNIRYAAGKTVLTMILFAFLLSACRVSAFKPEEAPKARQAVLDLRNWNFDRDGSLSLTGEWGFYWKQLLDPSIANARPDADYVKVPGVWTGYKNFSPRLPESGYATFYLRVLLPDHSRMLGFYTEGEGSAFKLWVNGRLIAQNGIPGTSLETTKPEKAPQTAYYHPQTDELEIVMQISNFHHKKAGFRNRILLGYAEPVQAYQLQNWFIEAFSVGVLFIMSLYYFFLFAFRTGNRATVFFAILCLGIAVRMGITNQSTLHYLFPFFNWTFDLKIEYLIFFLNPIPFFLYLRMIFPKEIPVWFVRAVSAAAAAFSLMVFIPGTLILTHTPLYYQFIYIFEIIFCLVFLVRIIRKNRPGGLYIAVASFILFASIVLETLILNHKIPTVRFVNSLPAEQTTSFGFLGFIFVQAIMLANHFSSSLTKVETLSRKLEHTNSRLQESEKKYRAMFIHSKDLIFICETDGRITEASPACEEILGYNKSELLGKKVTALFVDKHDSRRMLELINEQVSIMNYEIPLKRKDRKIIHTLISATQRFDEKGVLIGYQGAVHDITVRKQAHAEHLRAVELEQIAVTDPLTGIYNRRFFQDAAEREIERAKRKKTALSAVMIDIDHFKKVNDTYGHITGDEVLISLAAFCRKNIRGMDLFARYGGEEFIILMPETESGDAWDSTERIREAISKLKMAEYEGKGIFITISAGIAEWRPDMPVDLNTLIDNADKALYYSKESGRNKVSISEQS